MSDAGRAMERYIEAMNSGAIETMAEYIADTFHQTFYGLPEVTGVAGAQAYVTMLRAAYSELCQSIDDLLVDGDKVAMRATLRGVHTGAIRDIPASGNRIEMPYLCIAHVRNGKVERAWIALDKLEYLRQLGVGGG